MSNPNEPEKPKKPDENDRIQNTEHGTQEIRMSAGEFSEAIRMARHTGYHNGRDAGFKAGWEALAESIRSVCLN